MDPFRRTKPTKGFNFDLIYRNEELKKNGIEMPTTYSSGTCIAGVIFDDGVILAADTKITKGNMVIASKYKKIRYLADNIYAACAGTLADINHLTIWAESQLTLYSYDAREEPEVRIASHLMKKELFQYEGDLHVYAIIGGVDDDGPQIFLVYPHGSGDAVPHAAVGLDASHLGITSYLESGWKPKLCKTHALELIIGAMKVGMKSDTKSGCYIDITIMHNDRSIETMQVPAKEMKQQVKKKPQMNLCEMVVVSESVRYLTPAVKGTDKEEEGVLEKMADMAVDDKIAQDSAKDAEKEDADKGEADKGEADKGEADKGEADKGEADKGEADKVEADKGEAEKEEDDKEVEDKEETDKEEADEETEPYLSLYS